MHCFFFSQNHLVNHQCVFLCENHFKCVQNVWDSFFENKKNRYNWKVKFLIAFGYSCLTSNLIHIARYHYATYFENLSWNHGRGFFTVKRISRGITMMNLFVFFSSYLMSHSFVASLQTFFVIIILLSFVGLFVTPCIFKEEY